MSIKNIVFDIGGVLADPKTGHWFITDNFWNIIDKNLTGSSILIESLNKNICLLNQKPKNEQEEEQMFYDYYSKVLSDVHYPNLSKELVKNLAYDCCHNDDRYTFYDDVEEALKLLCDKYSLYIISNGWPSTLRVLKNKKIYKYFKATIISSMYSTLKEANLFEAFLELNPSVIPNETLYIDDRLDILQKANSLGFNTALMCRNKLENSKLNVEIVHNMNDVVDLFLPTWKFGIDNDKLVNLVLSGKKTATTSLFDIDDIPCSSEKSIILFSDDSKACIVETEKVVITEFKNITQDLALLEGENDNLEEWRETHRSYFSSVSDSFNDNTKVIFEIFKVIKKFKEN